VIKFRFGGLGGLENWLRRKREQAPSHMFHLQGYDGMNVKGRKTSIDFQAIHVRKESWGWVLREPQNERVPKDIKMTKEGRKRWAFQTGGLVENRHRGGGGD